MSPRASLRIAQERAADTRLLDYDEDERGIYILDSARPFTISASHRDIGEQSTGLALYFDTIMHFGLLMLVMFLIVGAYPLWYNIESAKLDTEYYVLRYDPVGLTLAEQTCDKAGEQGASPSAIISSSLGGACNDPYVASYYNCPTQCRVEATTDTSEDFCAIHLPCSLSALTDDERTECCEESLLDSLKEDVHSPRWILSLTATLIILIWCLNYHKQQLIMAQEINARSVTVGDYAVQVSGLGANRFTRDELAQHMSHYGEVVSVAYTKNIGTLLFADKVLLGLNMRLQEAKEWRNARVNGESSDGFLVTLFKSAASVGNGDDAAVEKLQQATEKVEKYVHTLSKHPVINIGEAFVTFNYEQHANNCFDDYDRGGDTRLTKLIHYLFPNRHPSPTFGGRILQCRSPPEPCDVMWENYDVRGSERRKRDVVTALIMVICILLLSFIQYLFELLREDVRTSQYDENVVASAGGYESSLTPKDVAYAQFLTMLSSFVIVAVNVVLTSISKLLTKYQRFYTSSEFEASLMLKLTVVHVLNSAVVPILSSSCERTNDDHGQCLWYAPGGLAESAFYLQLFNAFLPDLIALLDLGGRFTRNVLSKHAKTQPMMDLLTEPPEFLLAEKYASVCKTIGLALMYGPVLPVSYVIALTGLCSTYFVDKYLALFRCAKPTRQRNQTTYRVVLFTNMGALLQLIGGYMFYDYHQGTIYLSALIVWVLFQILPVNKLWSIKRDEAKEDGGTGGVSYWQNMGKEKGASDLQNNNAVNSDRVGVDLDHGARSEKLQRRLLGIGETEPDVGRLEMYHPPLPESAGQQLTDALVEEYRLPATITPGSPLLLPNQKEETGGPNRVNAPMDRETRNLAAMQALDARHGRNRVTPAVELHRGG